MESRFGHDFNNVLIHTGEKAAGSARLLEAMAFAVGRDIFFGSGQYRPETGEGSHLLAHELVHTIQSPAIDKSNPSPKIGPPNSIHEAFSSFTNIHIYRQTPPMSGSSANIERLLLS